MDDSAIPTATAKLHSQEGEPQISEGLLPTNGHVPVPPTLVPPTSARRAPVWAVIVGGIAMTVVAFGGGYAVNAGDADQVRDDLNPEIHSLEKELEVVEGTRTATATALDQCRDAVEGATALATAADDLVGDWQQVQSLAVQFLAAPVGSAEEAAIDEQLVKLEAQMSGKFGALSAAADRVTTDRESCDAT